MASSKTAIPQWHLTHPPPHPVRGESLGRTGEIAEDRTPLQRWPGSWQLAMLRSTAGNQGSTEGDEEENEECWV